jgi:hypothetical protein
MAIAKRCYNDWITIRISKELHSFLLERGNKSESFDRIITRLISEVKRGGV